MVDSATEVGRIIGAIAKQQSSIQENLSPDEADAQLSTLNTEEIILPGVFTATKKVYDTDIFILDHPTFGELDSATLKLDGGYVTEQGAYTFPGTFPMTYTSSGADEILYTVNF